MFTQHVWHKYIYTVKLTLGKFFFFADQQQISLSFDCKPSLNKYAMLSREQSWFLPHSKPGVVGAGAPEEVPGALGMGVVQEAAAWKEAAERPKARCFSERC